MDFIHYPSSLVQGQTLAFTQQQLEAVLDEWLADFNNEEWLTEVRTRADGDVRIVCDLIGERQSMDLGRAKQVFVGHPVCQKLMLAAVREEAVTNQCATGNTPTQSPQTIQELQQASLAAFPQMMTQLQQHLQQNPDMARNMTPEQQQMLRQMIMFQQRLQQQQQQQNTKEQQELSSLD